MKLEQLRYFLSLAKHLHLGKAANEAAISPSAISHSIQNLEQEFGRSLFVKQGRNLRLTEDGKRFVELAQSLLEQANHVKATMKDQPADYAGFYHLAATHGFCEHLLTPAWMALAAENPKLTAMISSLSSHDVVEKVVSGEADIGLCLCPHDKPEMYQHVLGQDKLVLGMAKQHPLIKAQEFSFTQLDHYPVAVSKATLNISNCETHPVFEQYGINAETRLYYDSYPTLAKALLASNAWGLLPSRVVCWYADTLSAIEVPHADTRIDIVLIWPRKNKACQLIQGLIAKLETGF